MKRLLAALTVLFLFNQETGFLEAVLSRNRKGIDFNVVV